MDVSTPINDFGLRLLRKLTDGNGKNVIVSPLSVSFALAMAYNGARADTKAAMAKILGASSLADETFNVNNRALLNLVEKADPAVQIEIANALWVQSGFSINPEFLRLTRQFYEAPVQTLDFAANPEKAVDKVNTWVSDQTHTKIPSIFDRLARSTVLVLTDAVYFKGRWSMSFDQKKTEPRPFHLRGDSIVSTQMMIQGGRYHYFEDDGFQAIRLPYGQGQLAMYVFLPRKTDGLARFLQSLDQAHWKEWTAQLRERKGEIVLPKFETTYGQSLNHALKVMGIEIAFSGHADFSRIHPPPPRLLISEVEHKTYVKVDEEGTEAAAATGVAISAKAVLVKELPPFNMVVDHPFFCAIAEQHSSAVIFAGVVTNPTQR
jgi:serpin B